MNLQERRRLEKIQDRIDAEEDEKERVQKVNNLIALGIIVIVLAVVIGFCSNASSGNNWDVNNKHDFKSYLKWSENH